MSLLAIEPGIPASRICHVIGFDKGPVSRNLSVLQKRGLVAIRTAPDDGRTHAISLTPRRARDPRQGDHGRARTRTAAVVLPEERRAGSSDRPAAAPARESRRRDRPEQHLIAQRRRQPAWRRHSGRLDERRHSAPMGRSSASIRFLPARHGSSTALSAEPCNQRGSFHKLVALATNLSAQVYLLSDRWPDCPHVERDGSSAPSPGAADPFARTRRRRASPPPAPAASAPRAG